jgi:hypothetical protein
MIILRCSMRLLRALGYMVGPECCVFPGTYVSLSSLGVDKLPSALETSKRAVLLSPLLRPLQAHIEAGFLALKILSAHGCAARFPQNVPRPGG